MDLDAMHAMAFLIRKALRRRHSYTPVDDPLDPCYDVNIHNPRPRAGTQEDPMSTSETAKRLAEQFPVGTRVRTNDKFGGVNAEAAVVNHSNYIHLVFDETYATTPPSYVWYVTEREIDKIPAQPARHRADVNRVHFYYNGRKRSGILNSIQIHPSTHNILMWVREDTTGDLKAFNLERLGAPTFTGAREVRVEGVTA